MTVTINGATGETTPGTTFTGSTSGTILVQAASVAGTNTITLPAATGTVVVTSTGAVGVGNANQSWQNVLASRSAGTTYTNSTIYPIQVNVWGVGGTNLVTLTVSGVTVMQANQTGLSAGLPGVSAIVPAGATYSVTAAGTISGWAELR